MTPDIPTQQALLTLLVHAAMADGDKSSAEREFIRDLAQQLDAQAGAVQLAQAIQSALLGRTTARQAAAALQHPMHRQLAYEWASAVCHADGLCSPAETAFLQTLQQDLQLGTGGESAELAQTRALAEAAYAPEALSAPLQSAPALSASPLSGSAPAAVAHAGAAAMAAAAAAAATAGLADARPGAAGLSAHSGPAAEVPDEAALDRMILNYAILNGALELLPQSWASMAILPLQIKMVYRVGKAHGVSLDQGHIKEFIAAAGVGLASQYLEQFGRKLLGGLIGKAAGGLLGGLAGNATGMAFSFASTYALGHLAKRYYAGGRVMSTDLLRQTYQGLLGPAKNLQQQWTPQIRARAATLDAAEVMRMVKGA